MERRTVLKNIIFVMGGVAIASCEHNKSLRVFSAEAMLPSKKDEILAEIVEIIIPSSDTPGAKELKIHEFVRVMVKDCYNDEVLRCFEKGLDTVEKQSRKIFRQSFLKCTEPQKKDILQGMLKSNDPKDKEFFILVKELTIRGYRTSEYFLTKIHPYQIAPGIYNGCVPVDQRS